MTREELREYVEELENQGEIPYYVYSNLIDCIDILEQEPTTKNDLGDDCVRRKAVLNTLERMDKVLDEDRTVDSYKELLKECYKVLPSVTPQEPILDRVTEIIEPLRHLSIDEMSGIEWQILQVINKYKAESEEK